MAGKRQDNMFNAEKPEGQYWIFHYDPRDSVTNVIGTDKDGKLYRAENNVIRGLWEIGWRGGKANFQH